MTNSKTVDRTKECPKCPFNGSSKTMGCTMTEKEAKTCPRKKGKK